MWDSSSCQRDWVAAAMPLSYWLMVARCYKHNIQTLFTHIFRRYGIPAHLQKNGCNLRIMAMDFSGHGMPKIPTVVAFGNDMRSRNPKDVGVKKQKTFKWLYDDVTSKMLFYTSANMKMRNKITKYLWISLLSPTKQPHLAGGFEKNTGSLRGMVHWFWEEMHCYYLFLAVPAYLLHVISDIVGFEAWVVNACCMLVNWLWLQNRIPMDHTYSVYFCSVSDIHFGVIIWFSTIWILTLKIVKAVNPNSIPMTIPCIIPISVPVNHGKFEPIPPCDPL